MAERRTTLVTAILSGAIGAPLLGAIVGGIAQSWWAFLIVTGAAVYGVIANYRKQALLDPPPSQPSLPTLPPPLPLAPLDTAALKAERARLVLRKREIAQEMRALSTCFKPPPLLPSRRRIGRRFNRWSPPRRSARSPQPRRASVRCLPGASTTSAG